MSFDYDALYDLQKNNIKFYAYLTDTFDRYSSFYGGTLNGNIPIKNLVDETLFKKMIKFRELTSVGGMLYFDDWQEVYNRVGIYSGMVFTYKLASDRLTVEGIYDNFILFKTVEDKIPYTVNKADIDKLTIEITS